MKEVYRQQEIKIRGMIFYSAADFAKAFSMNVYEVAFKLEKGMDPEEIVGLSNNKEEECILYLNDIEMDLCNCVYPYAREEYYSDVKSMTKEYMNYFANGLSFETLDDLAEYFKVDSNIVKYRFKIGQNLDRIVKDLKE